MLSFNTIFPFRVGMLFLARPNIWYGDGFFGWSKMAKKAKIERWLYFQKEDQMFIKYLKSLVIIKP